MIDFSNIKPANNKITIAIPTRGKNVDDHFGHCEFYTLVSISEKNKVEQTETIESSVGCGCKSDIAITLKNKGVSLMLAGNIGQGAITKLNTAGINVIRGCSGDIELLLKEYISGNIQDNGQICNQHQSGHECSHH